MSNIYEDEKRNEENETGSEKKIKENWDNCGRNKGSVGGVIRRNRGTNGRRLADVDIGRTAGSNGGDPPMNVNLNARVVESWVTELF